jgi:tetratricopeptide (TPR) repeat protein
MSEVNAALNELLAADRITFLAGAGCSIDPPSQLAAGKQMMEAIIRFCSPDVEVPKLMALNDLRFEALVETFRDVLDPDLRLLDYFGQCDRPNLHHLYLATMLREGHFVITTNFDFLIEYALLQAGGDPQNVIPVITKDDFLRFSDPDHLVAAGKLLVVKVHGSTQNVITKESTRDSLIATIQAFGAGKEGLSVFQLEPFKQPLLEKLFADRTLVMMGYSGSDDFDVVPTLVQLQGLRKLVWINHAPADSAPRLTEVIATDAEEPAGGERVQRILSRIQRGTGAHVYRVDISTSNFTRLFFTPPEQPTEECFPLLPKTWLEGQLPEPSELQRHIFAYTLYHQRELYTDALLQCFEVLKIADDTHDEVIKADFLSNIGAIYQSQNDYSQAMRAFKQSLEILDSHGSCNTQTMVRSNLACLNFEQEQYEDAVREYMRILPVIEREADSVFKGLVLSNLGTALVQLGRSEEAVPYLRRALDTLDRAGGLQQKGITLASIAQAYADQGNFGEADRYWATALDLQTQLSDYAGQERTILSIARSHSERGEHQTALEWLMKGYKVVHQRPWSRWTLNYHGAIAEAYISLGNRVKAVEFLQPTIAYLLQVQDYHGVLHAYEQIMPVVLLSEDAQQLADAYYDIATAYQQTDQPGKAIEHFKKMILLLEVTDPAALPTIYNNVGGSYLSMGDYANAREWFQKSLEGQKAIDAAGSSGVTLLNIGLASLKLQKFDEAVQFLEQSHAQLAAQTTPDRAYLNAASTHLAFAKEMIALAKAGHDTTARVRQLTLRQMNTGIADGLAEARSLLASGHSYLRDRDYASAEKAYKRAQMLFARLGAKEDLAKTRRHVAEAALTQGKREEAVLSFIGALADFEELGDYEEVVQTSHALGVVSEQLEHFPDAIDFYKRAFVVAGKIKDRTMAATAVSATTKKLAEVIAIHGEPSEATTILEFALQQAIDRSEFDDAGRYATHLAGLYEQLGDIDGRGRALNNLGRWHDLKGDYVQALKYFEEAVRCFEAINNQAHLQFSLTMIRQLKAKADCAS